MEDLRRLACMKPRRRGHVARSSIAELADIRVDMLDGRIEMFSTGAAKQTSPLNRRSDWLPFAMLEQICGHVRERDRRMVRRLQRVAHIGINEDIPRRRRRSDLIHAALAGVAIDKGCARQDLREVWSIESPQASAGSLSAEHHDELLAAVTGDTTFLAGNLGEQQPTNLASGRRCRDQAVSLMRLKKSMLKKATLSACHSLCLASLPRWGALELRRFVRQAIGQVILLCGLARLLQIFLAAPVCLLLALTHLRLDLAGLPTIQRQVETNKSGTDLIRLACRPCP